MSAGVRSPSFALDAACLPLEPRMLLSAPVVAVPAQTYVSAPGLIGTLGVSASAAGADGRSGDLFLAGATPAGLDFDPTAASFVKGNPGVWAPFVARYDPGQHPRWVHYFDVSGALGGKNENGGGIVTALAAGPDGSMYAAGAFAGTVDFADGGGPKLTTERAADGALAHAVDVFLVKYDRDGDYQWCRLISDVTTGTEGVAGLAVDRFGNAYLAASSTAVDPATGDPAATHAYLAKFSADGDRAWTSTLPAGLSAVAVDHYDSPWVAVGGQVLRAYELTARRGRVVDRIGVAAADNSNGHGVGTISAKSIAFDAHNDLVLAGDFTRTFDFAPGKPRLLFGDKRFNPDPAATNVFVSKTRPATGDLAFAFAVGGAKADHAAGAVVDPRTGDVVLVGTYAGTVDFDPSRHAAAPLDSGISISNQAFTDLFAARYSPTGRFRAVTSNALPEYIATAARGVGLTPTSVFAASSENFPHVDFKSIALFELPLG
ncbi:MAG: hypothetical protein ACAI43_01485 [Phycisphaerae bacterium]|nr:hypothetical protein [Tepidisphaeraceae bacterium]